MDERAILARATAGDPVALGSIVKTYQSRIRGFALRLTAGDHALADDLAQDTFIEAFRKLRQYRAEGTFVGWLYRIAYSRFLMDRRRRKTSSADDAPEPSAENETGDMARLDLERAMARISPEERAALTLCYALGHSNEEAAAILSLPLGTVKSHILRGREKLKRLLGPWGVEETT
jgi:RNA polymerase sigma-70 factor (ECF subfamily)